MTQKLKPIQLFLALEFVAVLTYVIYAKLTAKTPWMVIHGMIILSFAASVVSTIWLFIRSAAAKDNLFARPWVYAWCATTVFFFLMILGVGSGDLNDGWEKRQPALRDWFKSSLIRSVLKIHS